MTHRCPDAIQRQGSLLQNPSNARVMPHKIQLSTYYSVLDSPTDSGIDPNIMYSEVEYGDVPAGTEVELMSDQAETYSGQ